jgi:hypothetical protein
MRLAGPRAKPYTNEQRITAFWMKVDQRGPNDCWIWNGAYAGNGYGHAKWEGRKNVSAPRLAFFLTHGRWPDHACHTCDNRKCVNPAHIYDGNKSTNQLDYHTRDPRAAVQVREMARRSVVARRK